MNANVKHFLIPLLSKCMGYENKNESLCITVEQTVSSHTPSIISLKPFTYSTCPMGFNVLLKLAAH